MTKVNRIDNDLLQFINEDTGIAETLKGDLAQQKFNELQHNVIDVKAQDRKSHAHVMSLYYELQRRGLDSDEFKNYLKDAPVAECKIATGRDTFNETKYNKKVQQRENEMRSLIDKYNAVIVNPELQLHEKEHIAGDILKQFNHLKSTIISKSEKEFIEPEFETVKMKPLEALKTVKSIFKRRTEEYETLKQNELNEEIEHERLLFKDISEDDFKLLKQLQRLMNNGTFFDAFEMHHNRNLKYALTFDSLNDYLNREREVQINMPELEITSREASAIRYLHKLGQDYDKKYREKQLMNGVESMKLD